MSADIPAFATTPFDTDEQRWNAVVRRSSAADGQFFYSVRTTGVYCRPSCASRQARRENVRFHQSAAAAERAGFRACRRCRPGDAPPADRRAAAVAEACRRLETSDTAPSLAALSAAAGMSRFHFQRMFKSLTGLTPKAYAAACRARRLHEQLPQAPSVAAAAYTAGFNSLAPLYAAGAAPLGMRPAAFRAGGAGQRIRFAVGQTTLGALLVAATERGVCSILLGDDPAPLIADLETRFPRAELVGGDAVFEQWVALAVGLVEAPRLGHALPLDVRGTAFQHRVWQTLREIAPGATATYAEIAARLGAPKSARAVAAACAANPLAVAIPCHRVVRKDGALAGYRWGLERKAALLERERQSP